MPQRYIFVQHSDNVNASSTRRAVRSHAMSAVRRLQRQKSAKSIQLKWPRENSAARTPGCTSPDGQSAAFDEQHETPQSEGLIRIQRQDSGTPNPDFSEPLSSADEHNSLLMASQTIIGPPSEAARSLYFSEGQDPQPYANMEVDEQTMSALDHPQTPLGAGRLDPFQTSSIHINRSLAELIDHCVLLFLPLYKAPNHLPLHGPVPLINHRPYCYTCNILWHTMSQANSY